MWVIYRDPKSIFITLDKYTFELVEDKDILDYQKDLAKNGGYIHDIQLESKYIQHFVTFHEAGIEYFASRRDIWVKTQ